MSVPTEVVADGKAKILSTVNSFKDVNMEPVNGVSLMSFVGVDMNDLTFFWVELHLPLSFPFLQSKKILLDRFCISITVDEFVLQAVDSKEARIRGFDRFREVVYERQEQQWTQNCSLWHSRDDISLLRSTPIQLHLLLPVPKECFNPFEGISTDSIEAELIQKPLMRYLIKGLCKVQ